MKYHRLLLIIILLISPTLLFNNNIRAQDANDVLQLSLDQAREYALERSVETQTARTDLDIANRGIREITATGLPQISGSVGYQYYFDIPTSLIPAEFFGGPPGEFQEITFGTQQNLTAAITLDQMIFDGSYIVGLRAARIYREVASRNVQRTQLQVANTVTETYLLALVARENLDIVRQNLENLQKTLFETEQIMEAGFTDPINVDQLRLTVSNMENTISNLERQYRLTGDLLKFQIGLDMDIRVELTDSLQDLFENLSLEITRTDLFDPTSHVDYKAMLAQENFTRMVMLRERSAFLPTLTASFIRQENAMRNEFNFLDGQHPWYPTTLLTVNLNIPIFSSGFRSSRVQQARLELEKARLATYQAEQALLMQMNQAKASFDTALEKYENEKENLSLARRILQRTTIMQREGMASSLELTQANDQLLATQSNYLNAIFELLNAKNDLEKAFGRF